MGEINGLDTVGRDERPIAGVLHWSDPTLRSIDRIRYIGDSWSLPLDLSYAHGTGADGRKYRLDGLPWQVRSGRTMRRELYAAATRDGVRLNALCGGHLSDVLSALW